MTQWTHVDDLFIDGRWLAADSTERLDIIDPATEQVWGSVPQASKVDIDTAVAAARTAFTSGPWPAMTPTERAEVLLVMADEIEKRAEDLSFTNSRENGSPVAETGGAAANAAGILRNVASLAGHLEQEDIRPFPGGTNETVVRRDPIGVCALIAPWNFPINLMVIKLAPALLAGCTTVLKPAETTPLSIRYVVEAAAAAGVPDGVINLVTGDGRVGDALVQHPDIDKVAFTGSTGVGRKIAAACGELLRPVTLELGGKSAAVVLDDVNLAEMSPLLVRTCMRNTGQTCYGATRILLPDSRYDEILDVVTAVISGAAQGDPMDPGTVMGPVANRRQYESVAEFVRVALADGARATTGGRARPGGPGFFIEPTVLADVTPDMAIAQEEVFGPVVTVHRYHDVDEAIEIVNSTAFGLGGVVFSADPVRAQAVAERIDSGSVGVNFFASNHSAPFGGRHDSGLGVEYGIEGLQEYITFKSIHRSSVN